MTAKMDMGQLCTTRPNPAHQMLDPIKPNPLYKVILIQPTHGINVSKLDVYDMTRGKLCYIISVVIIFRESITNVTITLADLTLPKACSHQQLN